MLVRPFRLLILIRLNSALLQLLYNTVNKLSLASETFSRFANVAMLCDCIINSSFTCENKFMTNTPRNNAVTYKS